MALNPNQSIFHTFLPYVTVFHHHLHMVFISRSWFDIQVLVRHIISFNKRQSTKKQVDVTRVCTVSFKGSFPHILRSLQISSMSIQPSITSCRLMSFLPIFKPFLTHWFWLRLVQFTWSGNRLTAGMTGRQGMLTPPIEIGLTAGVTGRQGMLTPPRHMTPPQDPTSGISWGPRLSHSLILYFPTRRMKLMTVC
jgi:hypothetical protein